MSKVKKVFAIILSMAMILGMSLTTFAAPEGTTIVVNNLDDDATLTAVQVIVPDTSTETGWAFASDDAASAYAEAFDKTTGADDLQDIIWSLILYADPDNTHVPEGTTAATAEQIKDALGGLDDSTYASRNITFEVIANGKQISVTSAGVYAIKATTTNTEQYVYEDMAAYVSFSTYEDGVPTKLNADPINAKKQTLTITKESDEEDDVVAINDTVTYTIKTTIPYVEDSLTEYTYSLTDTLTNADYVVDDNGDLVITECTLGGVNYTELPTIHPDNRTFTVDLSSIALNRENANKELVIKYQATVKGEIINNEVSMSSGSHDPYTDEDVLYTAKVTMTKTGEATSEKLANAEFKLYRTTEDGSEYAIVSEDPDVPNSYIVTGWGTKEQATTNIVTGANGEAIVRGLYDSDTYFFEEVVAPEGYSINETDSQVVWDTEGEGSAAATRAGEATMSDTKLSSLPLPSTGGIGTTIFTIGGCVIMIAAAGLYFASRRRQENK